MQEAIKSVQEARKEYVPVLHWDRFSQAGNHTLHSSLFYTRTCVKDAAVFTVSPGRMCSAWIIPYLVAWLALIVKGTYWKVKRFADPVPWWFQWCYDVYVSPSRDVELLYAYIWQYIWGIQIMSMPFYGSFDALLLCIESYCYSILKAKLQELLEY